MSASIQISPDKNLAAIAAAAGNSDPGARLYSQGRLYVEGVTQAALEAAAVELEGSPTAAELLAAERAGMIVTRLQFARQSVVAGMMTAAEARAWAGAGTDTAMGTAALALVPEGTARDQASIVFAAATSIDRNNALMPALQAVAGLTDTQTDDFFRAAALL